MEEYVVCEALNLWNDHEFWPSNEDRVSLYIRDEMEGVEDGDKGEDNDTSRL